MELIKCLIKNLRVSEDPSATRLIKFTKADETSDFLIPPVIPSIATSSTGFNLCLAPVILPGFCDEAINHVGFDYYRRINGITFELKNRVTNDVIASGSAREYRDVIIAINTSSTVFAKGIDNGDGSSGIVLQNITNEDLQLLFTLYVPEGSESTADVYQEYQADYYNDVERNPTYNQIDEGSFEVCLSASACSTETKTLTLKKPTADLRENSVAINYLVESAGFAQTFTDTLVYSGDLDFSDSASYNIDHADTIVQRIRDRFEEYSDISSEVDGPVESNILLNNCIENRGDVEFTLRFNWSMTPSNLIELILSEDRGATLIRVTTQGPLSNEAVLTNLANGLAQYGYTIKTPAVNNLIVIAKSDVKSLSVVTSGYPNYSYAVNGNNWGYDGNFAVDGVYRDNVAVRPTTCTLGTKDPFRNFDKTTLVFKGYPLKGPTPVNFTKVTILPAVNLQGSEVDFLTEFTNETSFSFETCETYIREPS